MTASIMLTGVVLCAANTPTHKGDIYTTSDLEHLTKIVGDDQYLFGVLELPQHDSTPQISHRINNLNIVDGCLIGDIETLDTPAGALLRAALGYQEHSVVAFTVDTVKIEARA